MPIAWEMWHYCIQNPYTPSLVAEPYGYGHRTQLSDLPTLFILLAFQQFLIAGVLWTLTWYAKDVTDINDANGDARPRVRRMGILGLPVGILVVGLGIVLGIANMHGGPVGTIYWMGTVAVGLGLSSAAILGGMLTLVTRPPIA